MEIRRSGNFGIIDTGEGLYSFQMGAKGKGWEPSSIMLTPNHWTTRRKMSVNGKYIIPKGAHNDLPQQVARLLDRFYAGEGIMGKITGLQWGEGPRLYEDAVDAESNKFFRRWVVDDKILAEL